LACKHLNGRTCPNGLCREAKMFAHCACAARNGRDIVGLTVKPVGKLDAGNPHVQFDERGWETERRRTA